MVVAMTDLDALVISLERTPERLAAFQRRFGAANISINHLQAVDGLLLDPLELNRKGVIASSALSWPIGQIGCALSHLRALEICRERGRPMLILEDDVLPALNWEHQLQMLLVNAPKGWEILLLGWNLDSCLQLEWGPGQTFTSLFQPRFPLEHELSSALNAVRQRQWFRLHKGLGLAGYLISPAGAERVLNWSFPLRSLTINTAELPNWLCFSFDGQLNAFYSDMQAWSAFPPLLVGLNDKTISQTSE